MSWFLVARIEMIAGAITLVVAVFIALGPRRRMKRAVSLLGPRTSAVEAGVQITTTGRLHACAPGIFTRIPLGSERPVRPVLGARMLPFEEAYVEVASDKKMQTTRIYLGADVQIIMGAREGRASAPAFRHAPSLPTSGMIHALADGDEVALSGLLQNEANPDATHDAKGYRDAAHAFRLTKTDDSPPVLVSLHPTSPNTRVAVLLIGGIGVALLVSSLALKKSTVASMDAAAAPRRACGLEIDRLLARNDFAAAKDETRDCDDEVARAHEAFSRGDFASAHKSFSVARVAFPGTSVSIQEIHSAAIAHDFESAAVLTTALGDAWYRGPETKERRRLRCVSDAFTSRSSRAPTGTASPILPFGTLTKELLRKDDSDPWCHFLAADLETDRESRMWAMQSPDDKLQTRRLLFVEAGEKSDWFLGRPNPASSYGEPYLYEYPLGALYDPVEWLKRHRVALEVSLGQKLDDGSPLMFDMASQAALFHAVMADHEAAHAMLTKMMKPGGDRSAYIIGAIAAIFTGDRASAEALLVLGQTDSHAVGVIKRGTLPFLGEGKGALQFFAAEEPWNKEIFAALEKGDAKEAAAAFSKDGKMHLLEVLRASKKLSKNDLGPLREWLRNSFPAPKWEHGVNTSGLGLGAELVVAELLGDDDLVALLKPRVAAFSAAMTSRNNATRLIDPTLPNELLERAQDIEPAR